MSQKYTVNKQEKLLPFLFDVLKGWSKKTVKQRLRGASVLVNGDVQTKHDFILLAGDIIEIGSVQHNQKPIGKHSEKLEIIYQDRDLIAINKPAGLLSVGTVKENKQHALALLRTQLSSGKNSARLWPVHRLDRETSGILLFANSKETRESVMEKWNDSEKIYLGVVEGIPRKSNGTIVQPLRLDTQIHHVHVGEHPDAKPAITHYKVIKTSRGKSLLEIRIETGRQHQIRAHMAWLGHSIIGDERYGTKGVRMGLHASKLSFIHPKSKKNILLEVDALHDFYGLL